MDANAINNAIAIVSPAIIVIIACRREIIIKVLIACPTPEPRLRRARALRCEAAVQPAGSAHGAREHWAGIHNTTALRLASTQNEHASLLAWLLGRKRIKHILFVKGGT